MGTGELLVPLKWLAEQLDVAERIEFTGYLSENEVARRMQAADAFMLPTRSLEGFGLVTIEANAHGLPVVATPVGANVEVVGASPHNMLADAITPEALADVMRALFKQSSDYTRRAMLLRTHVEERFSWKQHDEALICAVRSLV